MSAWAEIESVIDAETRNLGPNELRAIADALEDEAARLRAVAQRREAELDADDDLF